MWERLTQPKCRGGMGLRDLRSFNLAMPGKQGWRLITRQSLCARVLIKRRYFQDSDFMRATRRKRASCTWRAILAGREPLEKGLVRRIVNGHDTAIWGDRWVSKHFDARPITPREGRDVEQVSDLLCNAGQWDEGKIRAQFFPIDANAILRQPLGRGDHDFWA